MEVDCEGCAGCCVDWRPLVPDAGDHERRGPRAPLDDVYNLVPLTRGDARALLDAGLADATTPRLWAADDGVAVDGLEVAAVDGRPAFFLGLRKPEKPVAPFGRGEPVWLPTCAFLDPTTLQCRIHGGDLYPEECADYPGHNLELGAETECERVEDAFGGRRLLDDEPPEDPSSLLLGPQAVGEKLFVHPRPDRLSGVVERTAAGELTDADRAEFVAAAVAASPGTSAVDEDRYEAARERARAADSWVGRAIADWEQRAGEDGAAHEDRAAGEDGAAHEDRAAGEDGAAHEDGVAHEDRAAGEPAPDPAVAEAVEDERGAPGTPGWDAVRDR